MLRRQVVLRFYRLYLQLSRRCCLAYARSGVGRLSRRLAEEILSRKTGSIIAEESFREAQMHISQWILVGRNIEKHDVSIVLSSYLKSMFRIKLHCHFLPRLNRAEAYLYEN